MPGASQEWHERREIRPLPLINRELDDLGRLQVPHHVTNWRLTRWHLRRLHSSEARLGDLLKQGRLPVILACQPDFRHARKACVISKSMPII